MIVDPIAYFRINGNVLIVPRSGDIFSLEEFKALDIEFSSVKSYQSTINIFEDMVANTFLKDFQKPMAVLADSFGIPQFSKLKFSKEIVNALNNDGLHIFINEPLVKYLGERKTIDKSNLSADTLNNFVFSNIRFETTDYTKENIRSFQLDCVQDLIDLNNLSDVSVYTPDYNASPFFKNRYPKIKLFCQDLFLAEYISTIASYKDVAPDPIEYKFLSTNWRYAPQRHLTMSYLVHTPGKYSWYFNGSFDQLNNQLWFDLNKWPKDMLDKIKSGVELLNKTAPLNIDFDIKTTIPIEGKLGDWLLMPSNDFKPFASETDLYKGVFCPVVNECDFPDPTANISEKTLLPIKCRKPFVLVGQPGSLEYARKLGFKTFDDFWDESYDQEPNHEQRFIKVLRVIEYIDSFAIEQLREMYTKMLPIIEHNYDNLQRLASSKTWPLF